MPAKNSAGPRPHLTHCLASRAHGNARLAIDVGVAHALEPIERTVRRDHDAAQAAVANEHVAAEPDPVNRRAGREAAQERREVVHVARLEDTPPPDRRRATRCGAPSARRAARDRRTPRAIATRSLRPVARPLERAEFARQLVRHGTDVAGAHGHDHVAVADDSVERASAAPRRCSTNTGSTWPRVRTARQIARPSAPAMGASPAA